MYLLPWTDILARVGQNFATLRVATTTSKMASGTEEEGVSVMEWLDVVQPGFAAKACVTAKKRTAEPASQPFLFRRGE